MSIDDSSIPQGVIVHKEARKVGDELETGEPHPMAHSALRYVKNNITALDIEAISSCALSGDRNAEICLGTWNRLENGDPVSDRYLMGLAWLIKEMRDDYE
jgi:hypothetical protein